MDVSCFTDPLFTTKKIGKHHPIDSQPLKSMVSLGVPGSFSSFFTVIARVINKSPSSSWSCLQWTQPENLFQLLLENRWWKPSCFSPAAVFLEGSKNLFRYIEKYLCEVNDIFTRNSPFSLLGNFFFFMGEPPLDP